jgi:hypothetical protein
MTTSEERVSEARGSIYRRRIATRDRRRWNNDDIMKRARYVLTRLRFEGGALSNEATAHLKGALRDDWQAREMRWSIRTVEELRRVSEESAEWFSIIHLDQAVRVEAPQMHNIRLQRLNAIIFELWGD